MEENEKNTIVIEGLSKQYETFVLNQISMTLLPGKIYGLVGRNGSGKTMLLKHICGLVYPTEGSVRVGGKRIGKDIETPGSIGVIIENPGFLPEYSGFRNLQLLAMIRRKAGNREIRRAMETTGLDPDLKKHVGKYSLGMCQRLGIAQALMEDPDILLLDEPLSGLDNEGVKEMYKVLLDQKEKGKLIVIASHSKEDVATLCDEIFRFDKGRIVGHEVAGEEASIHPLGELV